MIKIEKLNNGFKVEGIDNVLYPDNGTLVFGANTVILVTDESDMVTFRSASNFDVLFSGLINNITIDGESVTKDNIVEKFQAIANEEVNSRLEQIEGEVALKANSADLATVATSGSYNDLNDKPTIPDTSEFVTKTEYNPKEHAIAEALTNLNENKADKTNYYTKQEIDNKFSEVETLLSQI